MQGSLKKIAPPVCVKPNSQAPWPTRPKLSVWVAKALSCDRAGFFPLLPWTPPSCGVEKRRDQRNLRHFFDPASSQHCNSGGGGGGGFTVENKQTTLSQLRTLATRTPSLGSVGHGAWELGFAQTRRHYFFWRVWIYLLRKGAYRDFLHIILKHTQ